MSLDEPLRPKNPRSRRSKPSEVPSTDRRTNGFLWCRVCQRAWAFNGYNTPTTWPTHRCGRDVGVFHEFLTEDPNHTGLPEWKTGAKHG